LEGAGKIVFVAASHTVALAEGGVLWVWGFGKYGQLGLGDRAKRCWGHVKICHNVM
jgi:alpha-tubulin suppressor-like RCC1 family protein